MVAVVVVGLEDEEGGLTGLIGEILAMLVGPAARRRRASGVEGRLRSCHARSRIGAVDGERVLVLILSAATELEGRRATAMAVARVARLGVGDAEEGD